MPMNIRKVIDSLAKGKSGGQRLDIMLSLLFNLCIVHGFLPDHLISSVLIPIVKDKSGDVMDKGNYRPIALSSVISKVLEVLLLDRMEYYLFTSDNQFGFKSKHSTDQCIYILKELIEFYRSHNSPMYLCFLDASKAFDRVNHWTMFKKLLLRGVPPILVRLMLFWYRSQQICVRWGSATSTSFKVLNGVRQGGILSPILFNVYIDDLSYELSKCKSGCIIDNKIVNHIAYADDLIVFCPSSKGLQKLLDICDSYGNTHDIKYNQKKTVCMLILPRGYKLHNVPILTINSHELSFVNKYKYPGIITLNTFMDDEDISRQMRSLYIRGNLLSRNFGFSSDTVKVQLFKTFCSNMYCSHLWSSFKKCTLNKLRVAYNNCLRRLMSIPKFCSASQMFVYLDVRSFGEIRRKMVFNFIDRLKKSDNGLIKSVHNMCFNSNLQKYWRGILYTNQ